MTLLNCSDNQLTELDVSHNTALTTLNCSSNQLTELDISHNTALYELNCYGNQLTEVDLLNCPSIFYISVGDTTQNVYLNLPSEDGWIEVSVNSSDESSASEWSFIDSEGNELAKGSLYYVESTDTLPIYAENETSGKSIAFTSLKSMPLTLSAPSLSVETTGSDSVAISVGEVDNASGYTVEYSTSDDFTNAISQDVTVGSTVITGLSAETTYYFRAMAIGSDDYSNSDYSETALATTLAEPVTVNAVVNACIVFQDSLTSVDTSVDLPEGISSIRAGKTVYADIWIKDVKDADPAIIGAYMNMLYDSEVLTVQDVTYGTLISQFNNFHDVSVSGVIDLIGGGVTQGVNDKGDDEWIRLATVSFVVDTEGLTTVSLTAPTDYHDNVTLVGGIILTNDQIDFGSAVLEVTAACPMDIDGDGYIGMSDYARMSAAWRTKPGDENWNSECDIDGDNYVGFSDYAFLSSNWRKYITDPDLVYPGASVSPAALVNDVVIGDLVNQPVLEPEPVVVSSAASAVVEDNSGDLNNPIALEADETAKVCLTAVSSKTASDVSTDVPASLTEINLGDSFFVEIWVRNFNGYQGSTLCGLLGGYLNMSYPSDLLTVGDVTYGSVFTLFNNFQDASVPGVIDLIGGGVSQGVKDKGDDEWVRLATVSFTASEEGNALIETLPPTDSHDNLTLTSSVTLQNDEIDFGSLNLTVSSNVAQLATPTLTASATGYNSVSVTVGSVEHASTYTVEYSTSDDFVNAATKTVTAGTTAITGLSAETTYYFRAFANGSGDYSNSAYSETTSATTLSAPALGAEVNARIVFQDSLTTVDSSVELPEGISSIRATKTVYAEIWIKDVDDADPAIVGGYLNVLYDNGAL
ncbi:MAG: hypothetical protein IKW80_02725, partial [Thermoguttaceae bacterium]|nr:hypothetical protein [Thermoguttaceae bacterium]